MEFIRITPENIDREHICCAISNNKDCQVVSKKAWLRERFAEGLVFLKADARGKCFIEYLPAEYAWAAVDAPGYMYIDCLWVSGQFKGHGYADQLLEACIQDSKEKGKQGLIVLSSHKKRSFLSDKSYLLHKGFQVADKAEPYFELLYLPFEEKFQENLLLPRFKCQMHQEEHSENQPVKDGREEGFILYYSGQCPFTAKYAPLLEEYAQEKGIRLQSILIKSREEAQRLPVPFSTFALFYNGKFVTHEILSVKKFEALVQDVQGM